MTVIVMVRDIGNSVSNLETYSRDKDLRAVAGVTRAS